MWLSILTIPTGLLSVHDSYCISCSSWSTILCSETLKDRKKNVKYDQAEWQNGQVELLVLLLKWRTIQI